MITVTVDPGDLARVLGRMKASLYASVVEDLVERSSEVALREAQNGAREIGGVGSSFSASARGFGATVESHHPGAMTSEFGRRAGAKMPPPGALARYGEASYAIARAIGRRGIRGRFFFRKARETLARVELPTLLARAASRIEDKWASR